MGQRFRMSKGSGVSKGLGCVKGIGIRQGIGLVYLKTFKSPRGEPALRPYLHSPNTSSALSVLLDCQAGSSTTGKFHVNKGLSDGARKR